ncbi:TspO and MBR related proteins [Clostridium sp. USBA 49]|uniref:TspO/MBR family protein n=1 Tax=Clostridium sp. USBA 49 TaxID=1881060 RepID=UPI00099ACF96|nr:TspO/MBR family protein [Clostridium sp. USBA 49]SKA80761.1 TspO and MBR related proteins [Clostridium sp. USBA 49]
MNILILIINIIIAEGTGILSGYLGLTNRENYKDFIKPNFTPPYWVFIVISIILYMLMAIAVYKILLKRKNVYINRAVTLYTIQLILNFLWPIIFFRFRLIAIAFIEIMMLIIFTLLTTFEFFRIDKISGFLMLPYIIWGCFTAVLNFTFWMLNNM